MRPQTSTYVSNPDRSWRLVQKKLYLYSGVYTSALAHAFTRACALEKTGHMTPTYMFLTCMTPQHALCTHWRREQRPNSIYFICTDTCKVQSSHLCFSSGFLLCRRLLLAFCLSFSLGLRESKGIRDNGSMCVRACVCQWVCASHIGVLIISCISSAHARAAQTPAREYMRARARETASERGRACVCVHRQAHTFLTPTEAGGLYKKDYIYIQEYTHTHTYQAECSRD